MAARARRSEVGMAGAGPAEGEVPGRCRGDGSRERRGLSGRAGAEPVPGAEKPMYFNVFSMLVQFPLFQVVSVSMYSSLFQVISVYVNCPSFQFSFNSVFNYFTFVKPM